VGKQEWFFLFVVGAVIYLAYRHGLNVGALKATGGAVPAGLPASTSGPVGFDLGDGDAAFLG
jgi:hypothetical protein